MIPAHTIEYVPKLTILSKKKKSIKLKPYDLVVY